MTAPVTIYATQSLTCATGDLLFFNTITAPISLVNVLCAFLAMDTEAHLHETHLAVEQAYLDVFSADTSASQR